MKRLALPIACLLYSWPASADRAELMGVIVPPYPSGMTSEMGSCIPWDGDICPFSIATLNRPDGSVASIAAERAVPQENDSPRWKILDTRNAPEPLKDQAWAIGECQIGGSTAPSVIALVRSKDMGGWIEAGETVWAVRFDIPSSHLLQLDPATVKCDLPGS